jgi:hypothetical protein
VSRSAAAFPDSGDDRVTAEDHDDFAKLLALANRLTVAA